MTMKKILALALAMLMVLGCVPAMAQDIEALYDGVWVQFDGGFEVYMPSDWLEVELTEADRAEGFFYGACSADQSVLMMMAWAPLEAAMTLEELNEALAAGYPTEMLNVNGIGLICMGDAANNTVSFIGLDGVDLGYYTFLFAPVSDDETKAYAALIASSLRNLQ